MNVGAKGEMSPVVFITTKLFKSFKKSHSFLFAEAIQFLVAIQFSGNCKLAKGTAKYEKERVLHSF
jgi:hypothetical protein